MFTEEQKVSNVGAKNLYTYSYDHQIFRALGNGKL